jgi:hypothetical protein
VVSFKAQPHNSRGKNPDTYWIKGWVGLRIGLKVVANRRILPCRESNPGLVAPSLLTTGTTHLRLFEKRMLRNILGSNKDEGKYGCENYIMRNCIIYTLYMDTDWIIT